MAELSPIHRQLIESVPPKSGARQAAGTPRRPDADARSWRELVGFLDEVFR